MDKSQIEQFINTVLFRAIGKEVSIASIQYVGGGCINNGLHVTLKDFHSENSSFFVKWNEYSNDDLFEKESSGLKVLSKNSSFTVPNVIGSGKYGRVNYLILEYIDSKPVAKDFWGKFGQQLAELHRVSSTTYGLDHSNYIGKLDQHNKPCQNWIDFFIEHRLENQIGLAVYNNHISISFAKKFRYLYSQLPGILVTEPPSLIHGDLWSGNFLIDAQGNPALIDPAVYYANREVEISFTRLFGGFNETFYKSYHNSFPIAPGFSERVDIYNLYPLLVHVNLFGESYLGNVERIIRKYT